MGRQSRDARQRQALPGLSRAPWASLLPGCRDLAQATQPPASAGGGEAGTCRRNPGGAPQAHGPRGPRSAAAASLLPRPSRPVRAWGHRASGAGRKPRPTSIRSRLCWTSRGGSAPGGRRARGGRQTLGRRRCQGGRTAAATPPPVPSVVRQQTPPRGSPPAAPKRPRRTHPVRALPAQGCLVRGRPGRGHPPEASRRQPACAPA